MNTLKNNFWAFVRFNQIFICLLIAAFIVQILVGVVWWKIALFCIFLGLISWFKYIKNLRAVGNFLLIVVIGLWAYHLIKVEFGQRGPVTEKMSIYADNEKDVRHAEEIAPKYVGTRQVLIQEKQEMQNEYAIKIRQALDKKDYQLVEKLNEEQIAETKRIDDQIKKIDEASKDSVKNQEIKNPINNVNQVINPEKSRYIDTVITFSKGMPKTTAIYVEKNDKVWYRDVNGIFTVKANNGSSPKIKGDENHYANSSDWLEITGVSNGSVRIIVMPRKG